MGVVYKRLRLALKRKVALKLLAPSWRATIDFRERFLAGVASSPLRWSIRTSSRSTKPARPTGSSASRCATSREPTSSSCSQTEAPLDAGPCARDLRAGRRRARRRARPRPRPPGRQALERARSTRSEHVYLADFGLTQASRRSGRAGRRTGHLVGHARLRRSRADRGRATVDGRADVVRARLPALRVPDRAGAIPTRLRAGRPLGARPGAAAGGERAQPRPADRDRCRYRQSDGEGSGRPVCELRRAGRRRTRGARPAPARRCAPQGADCSCWRSACAALIAAAVAGRRPPEPGRRRPREAEHEADTDAEGRLAAADRPEDEQAHRHDRGGRRSGRRRGRRRRRLRGKHARPARCRGSIRRATRSSSGSRPKAHRRASLSDGLRMDLRFGSVTQQAPVVLLGMRALSSSTRRRYRRTTSESHGQ